MRRPLRDYLKEFYADPQIQLEGWLYSVGYRLDRDHPEEQNEPVREKPETAPSEPPPENVIVEEPSSNHIHESHEPEAAAVEIAEPIENI